MIEALRLAMRDAGRVLCVLAEAGPLPAAGLALRRASEGLAALADEVDGRGVMLAALGCAIECDDGEASRRLYSEARRSWPEDDDLIHYRNIMVTRGWLDREAA